ncbi:MAG: hypothetical protein Q8K86_05240 [Candidatus Nanopelagicaceae bacterium]|nr:hypothetical protein [Candidatus Nanopelagicaceae bacterium]
MSQLLEYRTISAARKAIGEIYNTAERHIAVAITREDDAPVAVIRQDHLKKALQALCPLEPQVRFSPDGQASIWLDGLPVSGQGESFEEAGDELIDSLRDYAKTWVEDLREYPNHKHRWDVVNLVLLSNDDELRAFLFGDD